MNLTGVVALGLGTLLVWGAIKNVSPLQLLKETIAGSPLSRSPIDETPNPDLAPLSFGGVGQAPFPGLAPTPGVSRGGSSGPVTPAGGWRWPTTARSITARYGEKGRLWATVHTGVDIDGECGDPIWSATNGRVVFSGANGGYGLQVRIDAGNDTEVWYNHFSGIDIRTGTMVQPGTRLGRMGETGNTTGCHLHFEVRVNGAHTDPMRFLQ